MRFILLLFGLISLLTLTFLANIRDPKDAGLHSRLIYQRYWYKPQDDFSLLQMDLLGNQYEPLLAIETHYEDFWVIEDQEIAVENEWFSERLYAFHEVDLVNKKIERVYRDYNFDYERFNFQSCYWCFWGRALLDQDEDIYLYNPIDLTIFD